MPRSSKSISIVYAILQCQVMENAIFGRVLYFIKGQAVPHCVSEYLDTLQHQRVKNVIFGHVLYFIKGQAVPYCVSKYLDTLWRQRVKNVIFGCVLYFIKGQAVCNGQTDSSSLVVTYLEKSRVYLSRAPFSHSLKL